MNRAVPSPAAHAEPEGTSDRAVLRVENLEVRYRGTGLRRVGVEAVRGVSFSVGRGETVALVGESGSGKSSIGNAILGIAPVTSGQIVVCGEDVTRIRRRERAKLALLAQMVFQNPYGSLNPSLTIGQIIGEPLRVQQRLSRAEAAQKTAALLDAVGLPGDAAARYPSHFSGGQRQRIAVARAIATEPYLVICDEPTSALDVSTQASVLRLLMDLRNRLKLSYLFITHDLAVARQFAHRAVVLNEGRIVEEGTARQICEAPANPYTRRLVAAAPVPDPVIQAGRRKARQSLAAGDPETRLVR